jgi:WD40 repeat protein
MCGSSGEPKICQGKLLFSASDDGSIRLWDLARRTCVRVSIIRHCLIGQLRCPQSTAAVLTMASPCRIPVSTEHDDTLCSSLQDWRAHRCGAAGLKEGSIRLELRTASARWRHS